tara:strand:+ start:3437 stop:4651 length:1215 start_codon:yes stop_codon:yes gene_type:complete
MSDAGSGIKTTGVDVAKKANVSQGYNVNNISGVYVGEVIKDGDSQHNGRVTVKIPELGSTSERIILLTTPFGGNTDLGDEYSDPTSYEGSPKTYGLWPQPPAIGSNILVAFVGSMEQGFFLGYLPPRDRNATMGGNGSGTTYGPAGSPILAQMSEKNRNDKNDPDTRPTNPESAKHLEEAGLNEDYVRGHSQSSARRESPSNVFGVTTKAGHTISLDDGAEDGTSNNVRIKTRGGHTILMDDTNGFIFIVNKGGSGWIEMDAEGQIDIYSKSNVSVATDGDYNVHAKGSINMQADQGVNIKSAGTEGVKIQSQAGSIDVHSAIDINSTAKQQVNTTAKTNMYLKGTRVDINGPEPTPAEECIKQSHMTNKSVTESVASRVPEHHPWKGASTIQETHNLPKGNST